jgi:hypothetical protein
MTDSLLREWRHRYNQGVSERRRLGFPKLGHYDSWNIDSLQLLVEANHHGMLLHPDWSNASDFQKTRERFGTVALHSAELGASIEAIKLNMTEIKLTSDQKYLCSAMGTQLPILPVHGPAEIQTFTDLVADLPSPLDYEKMALAWCGKVDGVSIFPKLPVYLRVYHSKWLRNLRIRDTLARAHVPLDQLRLALAPHTKATASPQTATAGSASPPQITDVTQPVRARLPHVLPQPVVRAVAVAALVDGALQVVGGVQIGPSPVEEGEPVAKRKRGKDGAGVKRTRT